MQAIIRPAVSRAVWWVCLFPLLLLPGCSNPETNVERGNREGVLYYGIGSEAQTLDPHIVTDTGSWEIITTLFEGLVNHHPGTMEMEPGVASHWEVSPDQLTVTFYLNPEARWSNGDPLTADDFVWSWQRSLNPATGNMRGEVLFPVKNARDYHEGRISDPDALGVKALDRHVLEVTLEYPTPHLFNLLTDPASFPVHRGTLESFGDWTDRFTGWTRVENMVGNGAFTLHDWQLYRRLEVVRSDTYWDRDNVSLNGIVFKPVDNFVTEEKMFRAGQLHVTYRVPVNKVSQYRELPDSPYVEAPLLGTYYYLFNTRVAPFTDVRVRQALSLAIDREKLAERVLLDTMLPSRSFTPPGIPGYQPPQVGRFDPERARALLAEAGYPDGDNWPGLELVFNTDENHRRIAVAIQQAWKDVLNIRITLANQEWKVYLDKVNQRQFQLARMAWIGTYLDPGVFLGKFVTDGGTNRTGYSDARYDEILYNEVNRATSREQRFSLMYEAEQRFLAEVPLIPLFSYKGAHLVQPSVSGYWPNIVEYRNFKHVALDPDRRPWRWPEES